MSTTIREESAALDAARAGRQAPVGTSGLNRWQNVNPWAVRLTVLASQLKLPIIAPAAPAAPAGTASTTPAEAAT